LADAGDACGRAGDAIQCSAFILPGMMTSSPADIVRGHRAFIDLGDITAAVKIAPRARLAQARKFRF
jgi:hypothetical protein